MDLLKKIELLINAKAQSILPRSERRGPLDEEEARVLAEIREALNDVAARERDLAQRVNAERVEAQAAESRGDLEQARTHKRRATELDHYLNQESELAIKLEQHLAALEDKLALAQEAVEQEAEKVARRQAAAEETLSTAGDSPQTNEAQEIRPGPEKRESALKRKDDLETRKSRLLG